MTETTDHSAMLEIPTLVSELQSIVTKLEQLFPVLDEGGRSQPATLNEATNVFGEIYDLRSNSGETYDVDPRGGPLSAIRRPKEEVSSAQVKLVLNWFNELRRVVPAK